MNGPVGGDDLATDRYIVASRGVARQRLKED